MRDDLSSYKDSEVAASGKTGINKKSRSSKEKATYLQSTILKCVNLY